MAVLQHVWALEWISNATSIHLDVASCPEDSIGIILLSGAVLGKDFNNSEAGKIHNLKYFLTSRVEV